LCYATNNQSSDNTTLVFNSTTGNYSGILENYSLFGSVNFTASCSDTYVEPNSNSTTAKVKYICDSIFNESIILTEDIINPYNVPICLNIIRDNIQIDCNGNSIIGNSGTAIKIDGYTDITIKNCKISNFTTDFYLNNATNIISDANTFNRSAISLNGASNITVRQLLALTVKSETDNPIENANITIKNKNNATVFNGITNSSGNIPTQNLIAYYQTPTSTTYFEPYNISGTRTGYVPNSMEILLDGNRNASFVLPNYCVGDLCALPDVITDKLTAGSTIARTVRLVSQDNPVSVSCIVSGANPSWFTLSPATFNLNPREETNMNINLTIPLGTGVGTYPNSIQCIGTTTRIILYTINVVISPSGGGGGCTFKDCNNNYIFDYSICACVPCENGTIAINGSCIPQSNITTNLTPTQKQIEAQFGDFTLQTTEDNLIIGTLAILIIIAWLLR